MASTIDFYNLDEGFGGKTHKRKREQAQAIKDARMEEIHAMEMEIDETAPPPANRSALPSETDPNKPLFSSFFRLVNLPTAELLLGESPAGTGSRCGKDGRRRCRLARWK
ncbi:unnamed protein product [Lathyrus oleraceus]